MLVPDADEVQLQQVGFVDARQPTSVRAMARRRARGRRSDREEDAAVGHPRSPPRASRDFDRDIA